MIDRKVVLSQEDFDLVWDLLHAAANAMKYGQLNAHRGVLGEGEKDDAMTKALEERTLAITYKMAPFVSTSDDPITFVLEGEDG